MGGFRRRLRKSLTRSSNSQVANTKTSRFCTPRETLGMNGPATELTSFHTSMVNSRRESDITRIGYSRESDMAKELTDSLLKIK